MKKKLIEAMIEASKKSGCEDTLVNAAVININRYFELEGSYYDGLKDFYFDGRFSDGIIQKAIIKIVQQNGLFLGLNIPKETVLDFSKSDKPFLVVNLDRVRINQNGLFPENEFGRTEVCLPLSENLDREGLYAFASPDYIGFDVLSKNLFAGFYWRTSKYDRYDCQKKESKIMLDGSIDRYSREGFGFETTIKPSDLDVFLVEFKNKYPSDATEKNQKAISVFTEMLFDFSDRSPEFKAVRHFQNVLNHIKIDGQKVYEEYQKLLTNNFSY